MDYEAFFAGHLQRLHDEGRYRVFAELERIVGAFPRAHFHHNGTVRDVTVWCSNDYLAMGQHPVVLGVQRRPAAHRQVQVQLHLLARRDHVAQHEAFVLRQGHGGDGVGAGGRARCLGAQRL